MVEVERGSLAGILITLITFAILSTVLISGVNSSGFLPELLPPGNVVYGNIFSVASAKTLNFADWKTFHLTFPAAVNITGHRIANRDFLLNEERDNGPSSYYFSWRHNEPKWGIDFPHPMVLEGYYIQIYWWMVANYYNSSMKVSIFELTCSHLEVTAVLNYSWGSYGSLEEAWNNRDVYLTIGVSPEYVVTPDYSTGVFATLGAILTFSLPGMPEIPSALIGVFFYAVLGVSVLFVALMLKPDWL